MNNIAAVYNKCIPLKVVLPISYKYHDHTNERNLVESSINDVRTFLLVFNPPFPRLSAFCLTTHLSLIGRTLSCKANKELQKLWTNNTFFKKACILYLFLVCLFIFQSLTKEEDDKNDLHMPSSSLLQRPN